MMSHVEHLIPAYLDNQLTPATANRVYQHICRCAACQAYMARYEQLFHRVRDMLQDVPVSEHTLSRLWSSVNKARQHPVSPSFSLADIGQGRVWVMALLVAMIGYTAAVPDLISMPLSSIDSTRLAYQDSAVLDGIPQSVSYAPNVYIVGTRSPKDSEIVHPIPAPYPPYVP